MPYTGPLRPMVASIPKQNASNDEHTCVACVDDVEGSAAGGRHNFFRFVQSGINFMRCEVWYIHRGANLTDRIGDVPG